MSTKDKGIKQALQNQPSMRLPSNFNYRTMPAPQRTDSTSGKKDRKTNLYGMDNYRHCHTCRRNRLFGMDVFRPSIGIISPIKAVDTREGNFYL